MHLAPFSYVERFMQNSIGLALFLVVSFGENKKNRAYFSRKDSWCRPRSYPSERCPFNVRTAVFVLNLLGLVGWIIFDVCAMQLKYDELWDTAIAMKLEKPEQPASLAVAQVPDASEDGTLAPHRRADGDTYAATWTETYTEQDVAQWQQLADPTTGRFNVTMAYRMVADGTCKTKSHTKYTPYNQHVLVGVVMFFNFVWTFHTSALFLLMVFFNHIATTTKSLTKNKPLGSSTEFLIEQTYSVVSLCLYPILQIIFRFNLKVYTYSADGTATNRGPLLSSVVPQVVNHFEKLTIVLLCIRANMKMKELADPSRGPFSYRFSYYRKMNRLLIFFLLMDVGGLSAINFDILGMVFSGGPGTIYKNQFNTDWCTSMFSIGCLGTHLCVLFMMFPPTDYEAMALSLAGDTPDGSNRSTMARNSVTPLPRRASSATAAAAAAAAATPAPAPAQTPAPPT